jgi:thermitase
MRIEYYSGGRKRRVTATTLGAAPDDTESATFRDYLLPPADGQNTFLRSAAIVGFGVDAVAAPISEPQVVITTGGEPSLVLTPSIAIEDPKLSEVRWLQTKYGFSITREGSHGKVLLTAPADTPAPERYAAKAAVEVYERGKVIAAQPNFVRVLGGLVPAVGHKHPRWAYDNPGNPGLVGADVAADAAWTITTGSSEVRVAVLDDGVQASNVAFKDAVVAQRDFVSVDRVDKAEPTDPRDFHGTACAAIIASRLPFNRGLAHGVVLVACRIGSWSHADSWIADDFSVADGIDWCWDDAKADVLSMSWRGGDADDLRRLAIERARTQGRQGKGCVVVAAAGNTGGPVDFPASADGVIAIGATNQWDERKTQTSQDGETNWASNRGQGLAMMAPGVRIETIDLSEPHELGGGTTRTFSGTSAATPFAAAAAALMLSVRGDLGESDVKTLLAASADRLGGNGWSPDVGYGRLNAFSALRAARRFP